MDQSTNNKKKDKTRRLEVGNEERIDAVALMAEVSCFGYPF